MASLKYQTTIFVRDFAALIGAARAQGDGINPNDLRKASVNLLETVTDSIVLSKGRMQTHAAFA
jgi:hypothetical protein